MEFVKAFYSSAIWLLILAGFIFFCIKSKKSIALENKKRKENEIAEKANFSDSKKMLKMAIQCHNPCNNYIKPTREDHDYYDFCLCKIHGEVITSSKYGAICKEYTGEQGITQCPICNFQNSYVGNIPESERCGRCHLDYKTNWQDDVNELNKIIGEIKYRGKYNENELNSEIEKRLRKRLDNITFRFLTSMKGLAIIIFILLFLIFFFSQM